MCRRLIFVMIVFLLFLVPMNRVHGAVPDLIAWWTCDEGAGNVVGDASGNGHDGTFVYGDPGWGPGIRGSAIELVGPTLVEVPPIDMELTEATMAGWIKPNGSQPDWSSFIMMRDPALATGFNVLGYQLAYHWNDTSDSWSYRGGDMIAADDWTFAAVVVEPDQATFYVNGVQGSVNTINHGSCTWNSNIYLGGDGTDAWVARRMNGALDDVSLFSRALTAEEIQVIMDGFGAYPKASGADPADGALHMDTWVTLSWRAGDFAVSHDVFLGEDYDNVSNATTDSDVYRGNQAATFYVAGFPGFAYPEGLVPGTTYYWRIDEVNAPPDETVYKGDVWSFTIPPKTAYNPDPADGAESVDPTNVTLSWTAGYGAKLHTVYFGDNFDGVNDATGGAPMGITTYNPGALELEKVYYWRVDEFDAIATHKGDVWSFTTPGAVGNPQPSYRATDVGMNAILSWTPADSAASHQVYFGMDKAAVRNADTSSSDYKGSKALGDEKYDPGLLDADTTYYWRVDEVDSQGNIAKGPLWIFTTGAFLLVDDFEGYTDNDAAGEAIWQTWIDGFGVADNGAQVGYLLPPYAEQTIIHGGSQSMPLLYINEAGVTNSEASLTLAAPRDWTQAGVAALSLWFRGDSANAAEPLYAAISNTTGAPAVAAYDDASAGANSSWMEWTIPLQAFGDQGINLTDVDKIAIGLGSKAGPAAGGSGTLFIDDIRLY
ncbi:LamG domain-containing protein [Planctomycetota bacterium]